MEVWTWVSHTDEGGTIRDFLVDNHPQRFIDENAHFGAGKILGSFNDYETADMVFRALGPLHPHRFNLPGINIKERTPPPTLTVEDRLGGLSKEQRSLILTVVAVINQHENERADGVLMEQIRRWANDTHLKYNSLHKLFITSIELNERAYEITFSDKTTYTLER